MKKTITVCDQCDTAVGVQSTRIPISEYTTHHGELDLCGPCAMVALTRVLHDMSSLDRYQAFMRITYEKDS